MSFQLPNHRSSSSTDDLEGGGILSIPEATGSIHALHSYLFERGPRASWGLFGCCILLGLINTFSTLFTLAETANLRFSDMLIWSNALLLSTGFIVSLTWRSYSIHHRREKEHNQVGGKLSSCTKLYIIGNFLTVLLSPAIACLPVLAVRWLDGSGTLSSQSGMPLTSCWVFVNIMGVIPISSMTQRREIHAQNNPPERYGLLQEKVEDCDTYESFDGTDGPTFLPQRPPHLYCDLFGEPLDKEIKAASTLIPDVSWKYAIEPSEALREVVHQAISVPGEPLPPSAAPEVLAMAAISIGVHPNGIGGWDPDTQYTYLMSRTCDRLAEIFQRAGPSAVPEHAVNVFLLVDRFERFDGVDVAALGADNSYIPDEELKRMVGCLKSRSASLLGC